MLTVLTLIARYLVVPIVVPILAPIVRELAAPYLSRWTKKKNHSSSPRRPKQRKKK